MIDFTWIFILKNKYGENEPISFQEICKELGDYTRESTYRVIREAIKDGKLARYDSDIYYVPTYGVLGMSALGARKVFRKKYITDGLATVS